MLVIHSAESVYPTIFQYTDMRIYPRIEIPAAEIPARSYPLKCQLQTDRRPVLTQ